MIDPKVQRSGDLAVLTFNLVDNYGDVFGRRGARIARREEGECREHLTDKQRREAGCIGGRYVAVIVTQYLGTATKPGPARRVAARRAGRPTRTRSERSSGGWVYTTTCQGYPPVRCPGEHQR